MVDSNDKTGIDSNNPGSSTGGIVVLAGLAIIILAIIFSQMSGTGNNLSSAQGTVSEDSSPGIPKLLDLGSVNCIPCKKMAPILDELSEEYKGRFAVEFIDVRVDTAAGMRHGIRSIPTQIFFDEEGTELFRHVGFYSKEEIMDKWYDLGYEF